MHSTNASSNLTLTFSVWTHLLKHQARRSQNEQDHEEEFQGKIGPEEPLGEGSPLRIPGNVHSCSGHINPAVTFAMCLSGKIRWIKFPVYVVAQFLGAFVGAAAVYWINYDLLMFYTEGKLTVTGVNKTAHIFATYPEEYLSVANGFSDQVMSTAILLLGVFAVFDPCNLPVPKGLEPIAIGLVIILLTSSMARNSGCAMNPARDLSPRLFTYFAGWGPEVFTAGHHFWWVPIVGPMVGAAIGTAIYMLFIELHHAPQEPPQRSTEHEKYTLTNMEEEKSLHTSI
uniref:Aquaporin 9 n=1 Tax=Podarcis muralis TaxID=64176 RepID=A0A670KJ42_PODMU